MNSKTLSALFENVPHTKVLIDSVPERDEEGCLLINAAYSRVSTDKQAEKGYGLDIQENAIREYAVGRGFKNLVLFIDDGYTGTTMERPALGELTQMIKDYNSGDSYLRIVSFIVPRLDRLGRTLLGTLQFIQDYIVASKDSRGSKVNTNREDIFFASAAESFINVEKDNPQSKFMLMIFASLAEFDRDMIVGKLKSGRRARVASGKWPGGGITPYGYRYDPDKGTLIVIPEQAKKVREAYRLFIEDRMSPQKISDRLGFKGERIVTQILQRKSLTGVVEYGGEEYTGLHEAIIPLERWEEAQDEFERRKGNHSPSEHLLSGMVFCGVCGAHMRYQKWAKTGECRLVCYSSQKSSKSYLKRAEECDNERFWAEDVEKAVVDSLLEFRYIADESNTKTKTIDPLETIEEEIRKEKRRLERLYDFDDDGYDEILRDKILKSRKRIETLEEQLKSSVAQSRLRRRINNACEILRTLKDTWQTMDDKERHNVCEELIDRIVVNKDGTVDVHLKIEKFLRSREQNGKKS